jgi:hypothetical protein
VSDPIAATSLPPAEQFNVLETAGYVGSPFFHAKPTNDALATTALPTDDEHHDRSLEKFVTLETSRSGEVYRGVAFAPAL